MLGRTLARTAWGLGPSAPLSVCTVALGSRFGPSRLAPFRVPRAFYLQLNPRAIRELGIRSTRHALTELELRETPEGRRSRRDGQRFESGSSRAGLAQTGNARSRDERAGLVQSTDDDDVPFSDLRWVASPTAQPAAPSVRRRVGAAPSALAEAPRLAAHGGWAGSPSRRVVGPATLRRTALTSTTAPSTRRVGIPRVVTVERGPGRSRRDTRTREGGSHPFSAGQKARFARKSSRSRGRGSASTTRANSCTPSTEAYTARRLGERVRARQDEENGLK